MTIKELIAGRKSPKVPAHFGKGQVITEKELRKASCGIGFDLPAEPDYECRRLSGGRNYRACLYHLFALCGFAPCG